MLYVRKASRSSEHPFALCSYPPVTVMGCRSAATSRRIVRAETRRPPRGRHLSPISAANLLSTSTRRIRRFPSTGALAFMTTDSVSAASLAHPRVRFGDASLVADVAPPQAASRPRMVTRLVPRTPAVSRDHVRPRRDLPRHPREGTGRAAPGVSSHVLPTSSGSLTLPVAPSGRRGVSHVAPPAPRTLPPRHTMVVAFKPEASSAYGSLRTTPRWRLGCSSGPPPMPWICLLGPASDTRSHAGNVLGRLTAD